MKLFSRKLLLIFLLLVPFFSKATTLNPTPSRLPFTGSKYQMDGTKGWYHSDSGLIVPYAHAYKSAAGDTFNWPGLIWYDRYGTTGTNGDSSYHGWDGVHEFKFLTLRDTDFIQSIAAAGSDAQQLHLSGKNLSIDNGNTVGLPFAYQTDFIDTALAHWAAIQGKQPAGIYLVPGDIPAESDPVANAHTVTTGTGYGLTGGGAAQALSSNPARTIVLDTGTVYPGLWSTIAPGTGIGISGRTITNTAPDQTVVFTNGTGINVTGTYPNFTVTNTSPSSGGTVTSVTVNSVSPLFTTSTSNSTTTPVTTFTLIQQTQNKFYASPNGSAGDPSFRAIVAADIPALPYASSTLTDGKIYVGNGSNVATAVTPTGDVVIDNAGVTSISSGVVVNADVNASAAIAYSKLNLSGSIVNADVNSSAAIAYSKLNLSGSIVNADINASAAIAYSKLNLAGSIVNADVASGAAIAYSKLNLAGLVQATVDLSATGTPSAFKFLCGDNTWKAPFTLTTTGASGASTFSSGTLNIPTYTLSGLGGTTDHSALTNLSWTASGHTGSATSLAGWNGSNVAAVYSLSGSGTTVATNTGPTISAITETGTSTVAKQVMSAELNEAKGADIASATTTDIGAATGNYLDVTGTVTITGLGTIQAGTRRIVRFTGALTLTHNATSLILPGGVNITTVAGDVGIFVSLGSGNWRCVNYACATVTGTGSDVKANAPTFTNPVVGTQTAGDNSTKGASTAYVDVTYSTQYTSVSNYTTSVTATSTTASRMSTVEYVVTAQAGALLFNNPSGSWADGQIFLIRIKDNGTARALTYGPQFRAGTDISALPSTTVLSKTLYMEFMYNSADTKFDLIGKADGY